MSPAHKLLDKAAAPTLERIHRDRQKAPSQLQPLLAYLETHLFDPDLDANQLKRACGVRDNSLPIYFHHALSLPPYAYIEDCRLEVACRLLRDTELKVWQIAQLLGYSTLQVFSRAFDRWSGLRPSVFRRRSKLEAQAAGNGNGVAHGKASETKGEDSLICLTELRKAVNGALEEDEAAELARRLVQLYPKSFDQATSSVRKAEPVARSADAIQLSAEQVWSLIESRPRQEQVSLVHGRFQAASIELFHLLVQKGIEEVRRSPERGIEIATLAVDCLEALAGTLGEDELRELEVRAYAWLANAYRLAYDLPEAEKTLQRARKALRPTCDADIRAEFSLIFSALRMTQRRLKESLRWADEVVLLLPSVRAPDVKMRCWLHRADLYDTMGSGTASLADLWTAHRMIDEVEDKYLQSVVYQGLSLSLTLAGRHQEAARYLPVARALFQELGLDKAFCYLEWTEALVQRDLGQAETAESHFRKARSGFYEQDNSYLGALVALDLAAFCATEGRFTEGLELTNEVITVFESLHVQHEVMKAVHLLKDTAAAEKLSEATLRKVRAVVTRGQPVT